MSKVPCPVCRLGLPDTREALGKVIVCPDCMTHLLVRKHDQLEVVSKKVMPDPEQSAKVFFEHHARYARYGDLYIVVAICLLAGLMTGIVCLVTWVPRLLR